MPWQQRRRWVLGLSWLGLSLMSAAGAPAARLAETEAPATVHKTREGLHFQVPEDWPIEKRNGVLGPIPIEEYLARKFSGIEHRLQELEKQTTGLDLRLRVMEESVKSAQRRLQSGESPPASP